jgi:DNA-binding SARP family transcriptional activator
LRQLVYAIRRDLEHPDVILGAADLRLNADVMPSDIVEFNEAVRLHDAERVVALYTGPFADGFYLNGAPEFERWLVAARQLRKDQFGEAMRRLARVAADRGDKRAVAECWRKLAAADPLSAEAALHYVQALADAGDRTGALKHARVHEALLRDELGVPPDAALVQLAERLRTPPQAATAVVSHEPRYTPGTGVAQIADAEAAAAVAASAGASSTALATSLTPEGVRQPLPPPEVQPSPWWCGWRVPSLTVLAMTLVLLCVAAIVEFWHEDPPLNPQLLAVVPYQTLDSSLGSWRLGMADVLATTLDGKQGLRAVPPSIAAREWSGHSDAVAARDLARRTGAGTVVYGFIVRAGSDSVKVVTTMLHLPTNRTVVVEQRASLSRTDRLVDSLTTAVLREARRLSAASSELVGVGRQ